MRSKRILFMLVFFSFLVRPTLPLTQDSTSAQLSPEARNSEAQIPPNPEDESRRRLEQDMAKKANQERQEKLKKDTDKLFALATELKHYVDKSNENTLSLDVVKKAEEIEKLARSVKDKMKAGY